MTCYINLGRRCAAAVVVLLAGTATADAQTNRLPPPAWANPGGSGGTVPGGSTGGSNATTRPTRPQNLGVWSPGDVPGSTRPRAAGGRTGNFGGTGALGGGSTGSLGGVGLAQLLTPEQQLSVLIDALMTAEALIEQGGIEFSSELEVLFFLLMIYQMKYQEAVQSLLGSVTGGGFPFPIGGMP